MTDILPDSTGLDMPLPGGSRVHVIGGAAITSEGAARSAICRRCGIELARWRAGQSAPRLRCGECTGRCADPRPG